MDTNEEYDDVQNEEEDDDDQIDIEAVIENIEALPEDRIMRFGPKIIEFILKQKEPSGNAIEDLKTAKDLVKKFLMKAKSSEVDESILFMVEVFKLKPKTNYIRALKQYYKEEKSLYDKAKEEKEEPKERALPPLEERLKAYPENVIDEANDILDNRDPFEYIMKTWKRLHIGDYDLGRGLACSIVNTRLINAGIGGHYKPS